MFIYFFSLDSNIINHWFSKSIYSFQIKTKLTIFILNFANPKLPIGCLLLTHPGTLENYKMMLKNRSFFLTEVSIFIFLIRGISKWELSPLTGTSKFLFQKSKTSFNISCSWLYQPPPGMIGRFGEIQSQMLYLHFMEYIFFFRVSSFGKAIHITLFPNVMLQDLSKFLLYRLYIFLIQVIGNDH